MKPFTKENLISLAVAAALMFAIQVVASLLQKPDLALNSGAIALGVVVLVRWLMFLNARRGTGFPEPRDD